ncbi:MAG: metallophosphoesterase [Candidatus Omnitrophota bacterium]
MRKEYKLSRLISTPLFSLLFLLCCYRPACAQQEPLGCVLIYGDTQGPNHLDHQKIVSSMMESNPAIVFHTGDCVRYGYKPGDWEIFNTITSSLRSKALFYPAVGNHDVKKESKLFFDNFELPNNEGWYTVDYGSIRFIILNSEDNLRKGSKQHKWFEAELAKTGGDIKFIVAIWHHSPFHSGEKKPEFEKIRKEIASDVIPLLEKYKVDIVFSGHKHFYERLEKNGVIYVVTGGGGGILSDVVSIDPNSKVREIQHHFCRLTVSDNKMNIDVFNADLNIIDRFSVVSRR